MGRALALYEVGDREEAIAEMEDVSISLKGYPGISSRHIFPRYVIGQTAFSLTFWHCSIVYWGILQKFMQL